MSLAHNRTAALWKVFMPYQHKIRHRRNQDLISMQVYDPGYFSDFNPLHQFEKWAAVEVTNVEALPEGLETFLLKAGLYAVFDYKGSSADSSIFQYIFGSWLPDSGYVLDERPHFEILGAHYKNNDPNSEEEIWIPIKAGT